MSIDKYGSLMVKYEISVVASWRRVRFISFVFIQHILLYKLQESSSSECLLLLESLQTRCDLRLRLLDGRHFAPFPKLRLFPTNMMLSLWVSQSVVECRVSVDYVCSSLNGWIVGSSHTCTLSILLHGCLVGFLY